METTLSIDKFSEVSSSEEKALIHSSEQHKKNRILFKRPKSLIRRTLRISNPKIKIGIVLRTVFGGIIFLTDVVINFWYSI